MNAPVCIDAELVLAIHRRLIAEHGGTSGTRDEALLLSALERAPNHLRYGGADWIDPAAAYTAGIVKNHPFLDGNKRTGFLVGVLFLELNGYRFNASEETAAQAVLGLAAGTIDEQNYCQFLRANAQKA